MPLATLLRESLSAENAWDSSTISHSPTVDQKITQATLNVWKISLSGSVVYLEGHQSHDEKIRQLEPQENPDLMGVSLSPLTPQQKVRGQEPDGTSITENAYRIDNILGPHSPYLTLWCHSRPCLHALDVGRMMDELS